MDPSALVEKTRKKLPRVSVASLPRCHLSLLLFLVDSDNVNIELKAKSHVSGTQLVAPSANDSPRSSGR